MERVGSKTEKNNYYPKYIDISKVKTNYFLTFGCITITNDNN